MKKSIKLLLIACCILAVQVSGLCADKLSPEQLVAEHLKSIGDAATLSQVKSITLVGTSSVNFILGMSGQMSGTGMIVSQGPKIGVAMRFQDINYPGEYFAYDGKAVTVQNIKPGLKSPIADFFYRYNKILKNGLLGGVFSNSWPLLNIKGNKPTMKLRTTKVEGTELYEIEYTPKDRHGEMKIRLYFDPATYRHVRTEYKVTTKDDVTTGTRSPFENDPDEGNRVRDMAIGDVRGESYYTLTEKFDDFKQVGAMTLPHSYSLDYMIDGTNQSGFIAKWNMDIVEAGFNMPNIDDELFKAQK